MSVPDRDQRTLPATPKRIRDFRKRGEIAFSRDLVTVLALVGGAAGAAMFASSSGAALRRVVTHVLGRLDHLTPFEAASTALAAFLAAAMPAALGALVGALVGGALQLGWPPALRPLSMNFARLFSAQALGNVFSPRQGAGRALKALLRVGVVGGACALALVPEIGRLAEAPGITPTSLAERAGATLVALALASGSALAALAAVDYVLARRRMTARMRMTPQEYKREHREQEGDPAIRRRRRQRMRELARRRLQAVVKTAEVVIVNPTEYAVALRYLASKDPAPVVVAKGRGPIAERIRTLARQAGVPILAQPPLARLIHKLVPEGRAIPASLYRAVAEVLAYVYKLRRRSSAGTGPGRR